jgi:hypothetical protein
MWGVTPRLAAGKNPEPWLGIRQNGVEEVEKVEADYIEADGRINVIRYDPGEGQSAPDPKLHGG